MLRTMLCSVTFQGSCAEKAAKDHQLSREDQDNFAINSYKKTASAHEVHGQYSNYI